MDRIEEEPTGTRDGQIDLGGDVSVRLAASSDSATDLARNVDTQVVVPQGDVARQTAQSFLDRVPDATFASFGVRSMEELIGIITDELTKRRLQLTRSTVYAVLARKAREGVAVVA